MLLPPLALAGTCPYGSEAGCSGSFSWLFSAPKHTLLLLPSRPQPCPSAGSQPPPSPCNPAVRLGTFNCLQFLQQFSLASYALLCFSNCQHPHILVLISLCNPLIGAPGPAGICGALDTSFVFDSYTQAPNVPPTLRVTIWDMHDWNPFWAVPNTGPMVADASPKHVHSKCRGTHSVPISAPRGSYGG